MQQTKEREKSTKIFKENLGSRKRKCHCQKKPNTLLRLIFNEDKIYCCLLSTPVFNAESLCQHVASEDAWDHVWVEPLNKI